MEELLAAMAMVRVRVSEHRPTYGIMMYLRWNSDKDSIVRLVVSKAKLNALNNKSDAVKAEMCVFSSRPVQVERWYHLFDNR